MKVEVEGPYGCLILKMIKIHIYIGAGIGITPFIARMNHLEKIKKIGKYIFFTQIQN